MTQPVIIKSSRNGLVILLDDILTFDDLLPMVADKFREAGNFFENATLAVDFQGRSLTDEQIDRLIAAITDVCPLKIAYIVNHDEKQESTFAKAVDARNDALAQADAGQFYKGTLRSGQVLESETSVVVLGDVNPGAKVVAVGNIIVLGALKGTACAGCTGNDRAVVVALEMNPVQIRIAECIGRCTDSPKLGKRAMEPKIVFVEKGHIVMDTLCRDVLKDISWG